MTSISAQEYEIYPGKIEVLPSHAHQVCQVYQDLPVPALLLPLQKYSQEPPHGLTNSPRCFPT